MILHVVATLIFFLIFAAKTIMFTIFPNQSTANLFYASFIIDAIYILLEFTVVALCCQVIDFKVDSLKTGYRSDGTPYLRVVTAERLSTFVKRFSTNCEINDGKIDNELVLDILEKQYPSATVFDVDEYIS